MTAADGGGGSGTDAGNRRGLVRSAGVVAGVILSGCSALTDRLQPVRDDPARPKGNRLSGRSAATPTPTPAPERSTTPPDATSPTPTPAPRTPADDPETTAETAEPPAELVTPAPRPADSTSGGTVGSIGGGGGGVSGSYGGDSTSVATPGPAPTGPPATPTPAPRTPAETITAAGLPTTFSGTVAVADRPTGFVCLLEGDSPVTLSFRGETLAGGAVTWSLCDPASLESYWSGGAEGIYASFEDWSRFDFGPFTAATPTALVVEPVAEPVTLSYSVSVR